MLLKYDPRVYESRIINKQPKNYSLNKNEIEFFVSLEYANSTYYLDETVYKVYAELSEIQFIRVNGTVKQISRNNQIKMKYCSDLYTIEEIQKKYNMSFPHKLFYCFPAENTYFGGFWGSPYFTSLKVYIEKCSNNTLRENDLPCKPIEYINSVIDRGIVSIMVSDYLIEHENYYNPLTKYLKNTFDRLSDKNSINYLITFSNAIYKTDTGSVFNSYYDFEYPIIGDFKTSYSFGERNIIAFFQMQTNYFQITYIRTFVKIQDLLSKIGGLYKTLVLLGMFLNYFYSHSFATIDNVYLNHFNSFDENTPNLGLNKNKNIIFEKNTKNTYKKTNIDVLKNRDVSVLSKGKNNNLSDLSRLNLNDNKLQIQLNLNPIRNKKISNLDMNLENLYNNDNNKKLMTTEVNFKTKDTKGLTNNDNFKKIDSPSVNIKLIEFEKLKMLNTSRNLYSKNI